MANPSATSVLSARDLSVVLLGDQGPMRVIDNLTLDVAAAEVVDIVGPSGSGKTTLLRALARLLPDVSGELSLGGVPASEINPQRWRTCVALVPQKPAIVSGSVRENLVLPWRLKVRSEEAAPTDEVLRARLDSVGMSDVALDRDAGRLSVGQQARVALIRVVLTSPMALLLDEPDAALDDTSAAEVAHITSEFAVAGGGVVRVRHQRTDLLASRRLLLAAGTLTQVSA